MMSIKSGIYTFANPRATHHVCGKAYCGTMDVNDSVAGDAYVQRLVSSGAMAYSGPSNAPQPSQPKLINRSVPEVVAKPADLAEKSFQSSSKGKDRK